MSEIHICRAPGFVTEKPTDIDQGYRMLVPYPPKLKYREKLGKVVCDCTQVIEMYRPWIGLSWSHHPDCAIEKHLRRYPGIYNFVENAGGIFAHTE
jgi:hypothetical protein